MARVITAQRADTCRAETCQASTREIRAGERINYGGYNAVTHADCPPMNAPRRTSRRGGYRRRYSTTYYRCTHEDYPCCGCGADSR